jgi:DNA polymerase phi
MEDAEAEDGDSAGNSAETSSESGGGKDDEDSNDEAPDLELRKKIEEALRVNGIEAATGDTDDSDDSEEEELMDDDQMMALDKHLADVFRSRTGEKKGGKGDHLHSSTTSSS